MLADDEPIPTARPVRLHLIMNIEMERPAGWVLDLAPRYRQGDIHGLADCVQVRHAVAVALFCPGELARLPNHITHRIRVGRRADPVYVTWATAAWQSKDWLRLSWYTLRTRHSRSSSNRSVGLVCSPWNTITVRAAMINRGERVADQFHGLSPSVMQLCIEKRDKHNRAELMKREWI